jgi:hypothetical protein
MQINLVATTWRWTYIVVERQLTRKMLIEVVAWTSHTGCTNSAPGRALGGHARYVELGPVSSHHVGFRAKAEIRL